MEDAEIPTYHAVGSAVRTIQQNEHLEDDVKEFLISALLLQHNYDENHHSFQQNLDLVLAIMRVFTAYGYDSTKEIEAHWYVVIYNAWNS